MSARLHSSFRWVLASLFAYFGLHEVRYRPAPVRALDGGPHRRHAATRASGVSSQGSPWAMAPARASEPTGERLAQAAAAGAVAKAEGSPVPGARARRTPAAGEKGRKRTGISVGARLVARTGIKPVRKARGKAAKKQVRRVVWLESRGTGNHAAGVDALRSKPGPGTRCGMPAKPQRPKRVAKRRDAATRVKKAAPMRLVRLEHRFSGTPAPRPRLVYSGSPSAQGSSAAGQSAGLARPFRLAA